MIPFRNRNSWASNKDGPSLSRVTLIQKIIIQSMSEAIKDSFFLDQNIIRLVRNHDKIFFNEIFWAYLCTWINAYLQFFAPAWLRLSIIHLSSSD